MGFFLSNLFTIFLMTVVCAVQWQDFSGKVHALRRLICSTGYFGRTKFLFWIISCCVDVITFQHRPMCCATQGWNLWITSSVTICLPNRCGGTWLVSCRCLIFPVRCLIYGLLGGSAYSFRIGCWVL